MQLSRPHQGLFSMARLSEWWMDEALDNVLSPVLRTKASRSYLVRFASVKYVLSSVASTTRLCSAACDWNALIAEGMDSCLNLLCGRAIVSASASCYKYLLTPHRSPCKAAFWRVPWFSAGPSRSKVSTLVHIGVFKWGRGEANAIWTATCWRVGTIEATLRPCNLE